MRFLKLIFLLAVFPGGSLCAQHKDIFFDLAQPSESGGEVVMDADTLLKSLVALQCEVNSVKGGVDGFRITLFRGNDVRTAREEAESVKAMYLLAYPDDAVYMDYEQPNWFVRVGDFKTYGDALKKRNELEEKLTEIKDDIYIVPWIVKIN